MKIRLLWLLLIVFIILPSHAQDTAPSDYRLRVPSAEEYLRAVPDIVNTGVSEFEDSSQYLPYNPPLFEAIVTEIHFRYADLQLIPPDVLHTAFVTLLYGGNILLDDWSIWNQAIILSWLNHNDVDLSGTDELTFMDYRILVASRDFNGDGNDEWILDVEEGAEGVYRQILVVTRDTDGYHYIPTPLTWFGCCFHYASSHSAAMEEFAFTDLTGDGQPEWLLAVCCHGGGHRLNGWFQILQWHDEQFIDISQQTDGRNLIWYEASYGGEYSLFPPGVTVDVENVDGDQALEIVVSQEFRDNWDCTVYETRIFDWSENIGLYQLADQQFEYAEFGGCELRLGQEAMWNHDYETAISHFERSIELYEALSQSVHNFYGVDAYQAYATIRLALAYSLVGRIDDAEAVIGTLESVNISPISELIVNVQNLIDEVWNTTDLCLTMYQTFETYYHPGVGVDQTWGEIYNITIPDVFVEPTSYAIRSGCDVETHIFQPVATQVFRTGESPVVHLDRLGIPVSHTFRADFNQDAVDDWIVWLELETIYPFYFASNDTDYSVTRPYIPYVDENTQLHTFSLPNNEGIGLMYLYGTGEYVLRDNEGGPFATCVRDDGSEFVAPNLRANLILYRLTRDELWSFLRMSLCRVSTFDDIFPNGTSELHGWQDVGVYDEQLGLNVTYRYPAIYVWDIDEHDYVLSPQSEIIPRSDPYDDYVPPLRVSEMLQNGEFEQILVAVDEQLTLRDDDDFHYIQQAHYYRALALEALGRTDEALAEYVAIYEAAPDSAWGMLAGLHIERVE